ncbi:hypothetical protein [Qipengyuania marisflavi]|uniref:DUF3108 domain-containing protein n=1 Tax=Qipengyuania marisflavi TaxID=2486356 RepID=A0A5S3P5T8_9SPHN|nr:hypothetical protein [Qipengyuania marisflavi]TMM48410.1 hypothetical protein FEV51_09060 [Qipengyuania marisflavi]
MTACKPVLACLAALLSSAVLAQDTPAIELAAPATATIVIDGQDVLVEIAPDGASNPIVDPAVAAELGLKGGFVDGIHLVGRTRIKADSSLERVDFGDGKAKKRRVFWFDRPYGTVAQGRVSPYALPHSVITYRLRGTVAGEHEIVLPLFSHNRGGLYTKLLVGDDYVPTYFTFDRAETMVTAAAGALLSEKFAGRMAGEARPMTLELAVERPVRAMVFAQPVMLGALPLANLVVRTQDTGSTADIPDDERDPNEIVVTAGKGKPMHRLFVGPDSLAACSTLTFDKQAEEIRLSCLPA